MKYIVIISINDYILQEIRKLKDQIDILTEQFSNEGKHKIKFFVVYIRYIVKVIESTLKEKLALNEKVKKSMSFELERLKRLLKSKEGNIVSSLTVY